MLSGACGIGRPRTLPIIRDITPLSRKLTYSRRQITLELLLSHIYSLYLNKCRAEAILENSN
jgi:hypothetical protein